MLLFNFSIPGSDHVTIRVGGNDITSHKLKNKVVKCTQVLTTHS